MPAREEPAGREEPAVRNETAEREELAARQAALVAALVAGAGVPPGLDAERVRIQAAALVRKRGRSVALNAPGLAAALDAALGTALGTDGFRRTFADYAAGRPKISGEGGSAADAEQFARYLLAHPGCRRNREIRRAARRVRERKR
jgi:hypothetical protein